MSKRVIRVIRFLCAAGLLFVGGCAMLRERLTSPHSKRPVESQPANYSVTSASGVGSLAEVPRREPHPKSEIQLTAATQPLKDTADGISREPVDSLPVPDRTEERPVSIRGPLLLDEVIESVVSSYPLLRVALFERNVAQGGLLAANGEFDLKMKAESLNMPEGFYDNYRQAIGAEQPLFGGGTLFGGYRLGRGSFPTYYGERETLSGGEFKTGIVIPLSQNRSIDERRAALWRSQWEVQGVEPEIQVQLIEFIRAATISYWNWVAAGHNVRINDELLKNATDRNNGLRIRVDRGDAPAIELTDNQRLIVSRQTKLIDAYRKFQQAAYKLSLFLRDQNGEPLVVDDGLLPDEFPKASDPSQYDLDRDTRAALANRPELRSLSVLYEQLQIDLAAARNSTLPQIDALVAGSQDVGTPSDPKKDDKSPFELEAGVVASVPLQRRKAIGKSSAIEGKIVQVRAKTRFTRDKIVAEVQSASAALNAAYRQLEQAHQALDLARQMETAERRKFDLGDSNLLLVNLREQATADAAVIELEARLNYFDAQADYRAALAIDAVP